MQGTCYHCMHSPSLREMQYAGTFVKASSSNPQGAPHA
jgi:hypothetical protein